MAVPWAGEERESLLWGVGYRSEIKKKKKKEEQERGSG